MSKASVFGVEIRRIAICVGFVPCFELDFMQKNMQLLLRTQILRIRNIALRKQNMKWEKKNNNRWANWKKKGTFFWKTEFQLGSLGFF